MKDTSTLSGQELPGQRAIDNEGINAMIRQLMQMVILVKILIIQLMQKI
jgi:hypothetical protein